MSSLYIKENQKPHLLEVLVHLLQLKRSLCLMASRGRCIYPDPNWGHRRVLPLQWGQGNLTLKCTTKHSKRQESHLYISCFWGLDSHNLFKTFNRTLPKFQGSPWRRGQPSIRETCSSPCSGQFLHLADEDGRHHQHGGHWARLSTDDWAIWRYLQPCWAVWSHMEPSGAIMSHVEPFEATWSQLEPLWDTC